MIQIECQSLECRYVLKLTSDMIKHDCLSIIIYRATDTLHIGNQVVISYISMFAHDHDYAKY